MSERALLQRKCGCGGQCGDCKKKENTLQRRAIGDTQPATAPSIVHEVLRSPGRPLDAATRAFFEPRFSHDFSRVRVHTGSQAAESADLVKARAYTVGQDIVFGAAEYSPGTAKGNSLLAHELTHAVQQSGQVGRPSVLRIGPTHDPAEVEAENATVSLGRTQSQAPAAIRAGIPGTARLLRRAPVHTGRILDEGTCADLVAGSRYICCDPANGTERKGRKTDIDGKACPSQKFTSIFTCAKTCDKALQEGCSDADNWMAIPKSRFAYSKCDQDLVICANGKSTHAYVRDKSEREAWEVGRAVPAALGLGPDFSGNIYGSENDPDFKKDKLCGAAAKTPTPKSGSGSSSAGGTVKSAEE